MSAKIHIPEGINFECTGCAHCCFTWPVPITSQDADRLSSLVPGEHRVRALKSEDPKLKVFTHTLEKGSDGNCEFLLPDKLCALHKNFGAEAKPSMCRLFPYTFTPTPSGVYASVSFAATGALMNSGRPLKSQIQVVESQWEVFQELFPSQDLKWDTIQLIDGRPLAWNHYLQVEAELLSALQSERGPREGDAGAITNKSAGCQPASRKLLQLLREWLQFGGIATADLEKTAKMEARPKTVDQLLIKELLLLYFPEDIYKSGTMDLNARELARQIVSPPNKVQFATGSGAVDFASILEMKLGILDPQCEDLMLRFLYLRIFSKLFFGPGLANLSLVAGFHHLILLVALLRIKIKVHLIETKQKVSSVDFVMVSELVRTLERALTIVNFSRDSQAALEVLLTSPGRIDRILTLAS